VNELGQRLRAKLVPIDTTVVERRAHGEHLLEIACRSMTRFVGGDVVAVRVGGTAVGPAGTWRRYTIAGADDHTFRLLIERNPIGVAAPFFDQLECGSTMAVRGPAKPVLAPAGDDPLLIVTDLTGLATVEAVVHRESVSSARTDIQVAIVTAHTDVDISVVADCWHAVPDATVVRHTTIARHIDQLVAWIHGHHRPGHRVLAIGGHELVALTRRTVADLERTPARLRTHVYWKPGRRGLE
jgi:NADPH-dependent ferric siderophore reductase